jgi:hypothetical protein
LRHMSHDMLRRRYLDAHYPLHAFKLTLAGNPTLNYV